MRPAVLTPSFRNRLRLFFFVIVVIPMLAVALVLFRLVSTSDDAEVDARVSQAQKAAIGLYDGDRARSAAAAKAIAEDAGLQDAINAGQQARIDAKLRELSIREKVHQSRLELRGLGTFDFGTPPSVAGATTSLVDKRQAPKGKLAVATTSAKAFADELRRINRMEAVIDIGARTVASTLADMPSSPLPSHGDVDVGGTT